MQQTEKEMSFTRHISARTEVVVRTIQRIRIVLVFVAVNFKSLNIVNHFQMAPNMLSGIV